MTFIERQYLRAAGSSDLRCNELDERPNDVDTIFAAGTSGETLASCLLRLRGEYDAVRGDGRRLHALAQDDEARAKNLEAEALLEVRKMNLGPTRAQKHRDEARAIRKASDSRTLHAHRMVILRLKTLPIARMALRNYVATEHAANATPNEVDHVVRSVLQAFLAPRCISCGGRGFTGGHRNPTVHCAECRQSGRPAIEWGGIEFEQLGREVLYRIEFRCETLRERIARRTRG